MYNRITRDITVSVEPEYLDHESRPDENVFVWAYHVRIENNGPAPVQLESRYWHIVDSFGRVHEVTGDGVVGEQPVLNPGESFEYTSGTPLPTPSGIMSGKYRMNGGGMTFEVDIPTFSLDSPYQSRSLN